jgi:hypothetical protein
MNQDTIESLKPLVKQFSEMIVVLQKATEDAIGDAVSVQQMKKILDLNAQTLQKTFQTLSFGIDIMRDEDMLRVWTPRNKN